MTDKLHIKGGTNIFKGEKYFASTGGSVDSRLPDNGIAQNEARAKLIVDSVNQVQQYRQALEAIGVESMEFHNKDADHTQVLRDIAGLAADAL